jgi:hypothetical protein
MHGNCSLSLRNRLVFFMDSLIWLLLIGFLYILFCFGYDQFGLLDHIKLYNTMLKFATPQLHNKSLHTRH